MRYFRQLLSSGGAGALGRYTRAKLRRRLFAWFGVSILLTVLVLGASWAVADHLGATSWRRERDGAVGLLASQLGQRWATPVQRDALGREVAQALRVGVRLFDAHGTPLATYGAPHGYPIAQAKVRANGAAVGEVQVFVDLQAHHGPPWVILLPALFAALLIWAASGRIARRLARPFDELARVAHDLAAGNLKSRVELSCHDSGETVLLAQVLNHMAERVEKQISDQRELLAGVSHELRTPLARIRLLVEIGQGRDPKQALKDIDREVVEIDALVGKLLASSRLDFAELDRRPLDGSELVKQGLERAGLPLTLADADAPLPVEGDPTLLARAIANLIENAQRHGRGLARLSARAADGELVFEALDAGPGFGEGEVERAFQAFFRGASSEAEDAPGLGLGLSLVRRIAEAHGGRAFAENRPEGGARVGFTVRGASA